jgi:hypothetical protein
VLELYRFLLQSGFQCGGLVQGVLCRIFSDVFCDVDELRAPAKLAPPVSVMLSTKSASPLDDSLIFQYEMESRHTSVFAAFILCLTFVASLQAQQSPAERVTEIQSALRDAKLDGWLFYDFRHSDPLAYRILKPDERCSRHAAGSTTSRRRASRWKLYSRSSSSNSIRFPAGNLGEIFGVKSKPFDIHFFEFLGA